MVSKDFIKEIKENVDYVSRSDDDKIFFIINCDYVPIYHGRNQQKECYTYISGDTRRIVGKIIYSEKQLIDYFNDILEQERNDFKYWHGNGDNEYDRFIGISIEYGGITVANTSTCTDTEFDITEIYYEEEDRG